MGRRFESCRAHQKSSVFTPLLCDFPLRLQNTRFPIVPIFVPTRSCYRLLYSCAQGSEGTVNSIEGAGVRIG